MGPLTGTRVIEFAGIGPTPFACMMLADLGAEVIRIDRPVPKGQPVQDPYGDVTGRGRASLMLDLKSDADRADAMALIAEADILVEGFRPGVMERLGLGPEACHARNPALVYGRMTGWGQDGPLSHTAGHDINYISLSGALWSFGEGDRRPLPPLNLLGDFGAGSTFLVVGVLAALMRARETGQGDVVDAAICDGANLLMGFVRGLHARGHWGYERASNRLDGAAPFYSVYECADGKWFSVGALEPQFFAELLRLTGLSAEDFTDRHNPERWPELADRLRAVFRTRTRDEWSAIFDGTDACCAPVLDPQEALADPHNLARRLNDMSQGFAQPMPTPRFARAQCDLPKPAPHLGEGGEDRFRQWTGRARTEAEPASA
ncbi:CoA transferase [Mameliella alba]|nr:CoA transferase [Mameliella alba]MBY6170484.1 CoA transferase [Mameliella alba]MBY6175502.1 CoA transferase [Mameliella alba]